MPLGGFSILILDKAKSYLGQEKGVSYMEKEKNERRSFLKYLLSSVAFGLTFFFSFKKDEGFRIGKFNTPSINTPEAYGMCGAGLGCAGGGGRCGAGLGCAGN
jgi:hypothetical protein